MDDPPPAHAGARRPRIRRQRRRRAGAAGLAHDRDCRDAREPRRQPVGRQDAGDVDRPSPRGSRCGGRDHREGRSDGEGPEPLARRGWLAGAFDARAGGQAAVAGDADGHLVARTRRGGRADLRGHGGDGARSADPIHLDRRDLRRPGPDGGSDAAALHQCRRSGDQCRRDVGLHSGDERDAGADRPERRPARRGGRGRREHPDPDDREYLRPRQPRAHG